MKRITFLYVVLLFLVAQLLRAQEKGFLLAKEYEQQGLYKKALRTYKALLKREKNKRVHEAYFKLLLRLHMYEVAEAYLRKRLKEVDDLYLRVDLLYLWQEVGEKQRLKRELSQLIYQVKRNSYKLHSLANYLSKHRMYKEALQVYQKGREVEKTPGTYTLPIAQLYFALGQRREAIDEYLNYLRLHPNYLNYIQELVRSSYVEESDEQVLRELLLVHRQRYPDVRSLLDLSVWFLVSLGAYEEAFSEAVAVDRRSSLGPLFFMDIGKKALRERAYATAADIFSYVATAYATSTEARTARYQRLYAREQSYLNTFPITEKKLQRLVIDYTKFISEQSKDTQRVYAQLRVAELYARWLQLPDSAVSLLQTTVKATPPRSKLRAEVKLALGDAYLLSARPWEATLQYIQVEKETRSTDLREKAQLRRAKTNYYQGAFTLAKEQLSALQQASSKYTANDALFLSLLISFYAGSEEDTSTHQPLLKLAEAELAMEGAKMQQVEEKLEDLLRQWPEHSISHYVRYLSADLRRRQGDFFTAVKLLDEALAKPSVPLFKDKLLRLKGKILEEDIEDIAAARKVYQKFITQAPQSVYLPEVRHRLQQLQAPSLSP